MKKYNKKYAIYKITKAFLYFVFIAFCLIVMFLTDKTQKTIDFKFILSAILVYASSFITTTIYIILYYNTLRYEVGEKELILKKGVIFRKTTILSYDKIHAVDKKQGLIQKLFGLTSLSIDSGATTRAQFAEIVIYEDKYAIDEINSFIDNKRFNKEAKNIFEEKRIENIEEYSFNTKGKFVYSLINSFFFFCIMLLSVFCCSIILFFVKDKPILLFFILGFFIVYIIVFAINFISSLFMYYDFKVSKTEKELIIESGFFTRVVNKLAYSRIHAVNVSQGFFQRIFGYSSIKLSVVGFGTVESQNNGQGNIISCLIPFCRKSDVKTYLEMLLPDYNYKEKEIKSTNFRYHYLASTIISTIIYFLVLVLSLGTLLINKDIYLAIFGISSCAYVFIIVLTMIISYLQYRNSGLTIEDDKLIVFNGSIIFNTFIIKKEHLTSIERKDTYLRRKKNLTTYIVHFFANSLSNTLHIPIIKDEYFEKIDNLIKK